MYLAIDPGACTGWAVFTRDRVLVACGIGTPLDGPYAVTEVIVEHPVIYPRGRTKNPNDVLKVGVNAGEWAGRYAERGKVVRYVEPARWKGKVAKRVHQPRIVETLTDTERALVFKRCKDIAPKWSADKIAAAPDSATWRNMVDAVGLGLFLVGR